MVNRIRGVRKFGQPFTDKERLISHFGYEKAMQLLRDYGEDAYNFLPERGTRIRLGWSPYGYGDKANSYFTLQELESIDFRIPIGNFFKKVWRGVRNAAKGVFNVGRWIITKAWLMARLPVLVPLAAQACFRKGVVPKNARQLHDILVNDTLFKKAFGDLCRKSKKKRKKRVGNISMRIADIKKSLDNYGIAELLDDETPNQLEEDVGWVQVVLTIASILLPLVVQYMQAKQKGLSAQEALNQVQGSTSWQNALNELQAEPDTPVGSVKTTLPNEAKNWFLNNWWIPAAGIGGLLLIITLAARPRQQLPPPYYPMPYPPRRY